jgi:hypothetical protein
MFRASHITSACGGLLFGSLASIGQTLTVLAFFPVVFFLVVGLPQYREGMTRRRERAACREIHRPDDWQRFRDDFRLFYVPTWCRMLTFLFCAIIADIVVKKL